VPFGLGTLSATTHFEPDPTPALKGRLCGRSCSKLACKRSLTFRFVCIVNYERLQMAPPFPSATERDDRSRRGFLKASSMNMLQKFVVMFYIFCMKEVVCLRKLAP
jgi:hypothetical protein